MRLLLILLVFFAMVIAAGFGVNHLLDTTTADLLENIDRIGIELKDSNWEAAYSHTVALQGKWEKKAQWWPMILDHQEMDNIEFAMARFREYVATRNSSLSRVQLSELRIMIKHIPEKESITLKNIL